MFGWVRKGELLVLGALVLRFLLLPAQAQGEPPQIATLHEQVVRLYEAGKYDEAIPIAQRVLELAERESGPDHPDVGSALNDLAVLFWKQGRFADAEGLTERSLAIYEKALGPEHPFVAAALGNLAGLYRYRGKYTDAERLLKRSLAITEKSQGKEHPDVALALTNLADLYEAIGRSGDTEALYKRAIAIAEKALGPDHPNVADSLNSLAGLYWSQGRHADAEPLYQRVLTIREKTFGPDAPQVASALGNLTQLHASQSAWSPAMLAIERATSILTHHGRAIAFHRADRKSEIGRATKYFRAYVAIMYRKNGGQQSDVERTYQMAQWALQSDAADALTAMAARFSVGSGALARLVREEQDLSTLREAADHSLIVASQHSGATWERQVVQELDARLDKVHARLAHDFPEYEAFASPSPIDIVRTQQLLREDEVLLQFLNVPPIGAMPEGTFIWVVSKTHSRWIRIDPGANALGERIQALRCGLDQAAWEDEGAIRCRALLNTTHSGDDAKAGKPLPFDLTLAYELYQVLFGEIEDLIKDKHLLIVPSGPLTAMPFHVLVSKKSPAAIPADLHGYAQAPWLLRRHAITVLPSVASLQALRQFAKTSKSTEPYIGFGNPLLTGPEGHDRRAWEHQSCNSSAAPAQTVSRTVRSSIPKFFRNGLADVDEVRAQYPLPETSDELCAVAQATGADSNRVYLGEKANEKVIKALSADGTLARARVVHFATHGLLAGETQMLASSKAEPALILTPPQTATEEDDGLLTASEIAQLELDADWVVLSACNTAGGDEKGAAPLSGLARAFFYAGARSLLVSHWAVDSHATVRLITGAFRELQRDPSIGRAEALRRASIALTRDPLTAHPSYWAPFILVGEGQAASPATNRFDTTKKGSTKKAAQPDWKRGVFQ
jgi:CHAT domain-containing protein